MMVCVTGCCVAVGSDLKLDVGDDFEGLSLLADLLDFEICENWICVCNCVVRFFLILQIVINCP